MTSNLPEFFDEDMYGIVHEIDKDEIEYGVDGSDLEYERKSVAEMRGVCSFNYNGTTIFVKADVEEVAHSLREHRGTYQEQLFHKNDLLEPSMTFENFVGYILHKPGHKITIQDPDNMIKRIDFVASSS
jgi:hypothetical protein